jgi:hypothetical protein
MTTADGISSHTIGTEAGKLFRGNIVRVWSQNGKPPIIIAPFILRPRTDFSALFPPTFRATKATVLGAPAIVWSILARAPWALSLTAV